VKDTIIPLKKYCCSASVSWIK